MYKLYTRAGSGGFVVEAALEMAGAPFERVNVIKGINPDEQFGKISPLGQVPALVLPEGQSMTESAAMCQLIAERFPNAKLAPPPGAAGRADFLRWMTFLTSVMYPVILRIYYAPRYSADPNGADGVKTAAIAEADRGFGVVEAALEGRQWLAGERMSIVDVYLLMLAYWHPEPGKAAAAWPNIQRVCKMLRDVPVIKDLNIRHELW
ncbi:glutathione S-transferase family protein [Aminobacter sp. HY435]|uniref:glutathione S-transferase family protein n=1 Tax=Aminobacter sp. HY435 TaxID=2970917 RepID=UPI0022B99D26|nr:glutathione S-transferase family protein [Aminobacter sp. HY435]